MQCCIGYIVIKDRVMVWSDFIIFPIDKWRTANTSKDEVRTVKIVINMSMHMVDSIHVTIQTYYVGGGELVSYTQDTQPRCILWM